MLWTTSRYVTHPAYSGNHFDVALWRMGSLIDLVHCRNAGYFLLKSWILNWCHLLQIRHYQNIRPICLPWPLPSSSLPLANASKVLIAGWGNHLEFNDTHGIVQSRVLHQARIKIDTWFAFATDVRTLGWIAHAWQPVLSDVLQFATNYGIHDLRNKLRYSQKEPLRRKWPVCFKFTY